MIRAQVVWGNRDKYGPGPTPEMATLSSSEGGVRQRFRDVLGWHQPLISDKLAFAILLLFARFFLNIRNFQTFESETGIPDEIYEELNLISDRLTVAHNWQQNDLLMLDNTRFVHRRNAIEDANHRPIPTQFGYASFAVRDERTIRAQPWRQPRGVVRRMPEPRMKQGS